MTKLEIGNDLFLSTKPPPSKKKTEKKKQKKTWRLEWFHLEAILTPKDHHGPPGFFSEKLRPLSCGFCWILAIFSPFWAQGSTKNGHGQSHDCQVSNVKVLGCRCFTISFWCKCNNVLLKSSLQSRYEMTTLQFLAMCSWKCFYYPGHCWGDLPKQSIWCSKQGDQLSKCSTLPKSRIQTWIRFFLGCLTITYWQCLTCPHKCEVSSWKRHL